MTGERKITVVDYVRFKNNDLSAFSSEDTVVEYEHELYEVTTIMHKDSVEVYRRRLDEEESDMGKEELKKRISEELKSRADKRGYVVIPDHFGIGGYMCEVNRIEKFLFPIIDKVLKSND